MGKKSAIIWKKYRVAINIKNEEVSRRAMELAKAMGESITEAVGQAIEEKLGRIQRQLGRKGIGAKLMALSDKCIRNAPEEWRTYDYETELYDERGMPR